MLNDLTFRSIAFPKELYAIVESGRIFSIFTLPTLFGFICSVLILSLFHFIYNYFSSNIQNKLEITFLFSMLFLGIFNLILTASFGAVLNLIIGFFIYLYFRKRINVKYLSMIFMSIFLMIFVVISLRYNEAKNLEPIKLRLTNWNQAIRMISDNPFFGVGLGNYAKNVSYYTESNEAKSLYTHNFFLQLTAEIGIPIIILLILLIFVNRKKIIPEDYKAKLLYLSILLMLIFYNFIDIGFYFFAAGMIYSIAASQVYRKESKQNINIHLLVLIVSVFIYGIIYMSDDYVSEANIELSMNKKAKAETLYEKSLKMNPYNFIALLGKANTSKGGIYSIEGSELIDNALMIFPDYGEALFNKSLVSYRKGYFLSALYYAGAASNKNRFNTKYRKWYEFNKKNLSSRNTVKRN